MILGWFSEKESEVFCFFQKFNFSETLCWKKWRRWEVSKLMINFT